MSKNSDHVKRWRENTKDRIIESMGGGCCVCGYNITHRSLTLHHINPMDKEISLGSIRATPRKWDIIVSELRKCVMVCANCHGEIHAGITTIPIHAPKFNEYYADYKHILKLSKIKITQCPVCDKDMPLGQKTCSLICSGKQHRRVDWDNIDLAEMLKVKSYISIAEDLGISDAAVHKRAKKLGLK